MIPAYQTMMTSIITADRSQVDDQNSLDVSSTSLVAQQYHTSGTDIAASVEVVHVSGDQAAWKGEWATKVNSHNSALDDLERDRIEDSADDHIARSDERAATVRTYSLAHHAERKTRDEAVDEFWSDFALEHATLLDSVAAGSSDSTPWQDHLEAEADATLTKLTDEKTPRENHGETISLNEKIYADELAARRFALQHDRNVQAKADALAEHDELVTEQEDLTADDGYELQKLEYTAAPFEPTLNAESDLAGWETGLQSDRHWAIQGYERHPGFAPVELMEQALTAGTQDEYGDFDFTGAAWDADGITPNRYFFQLNPTAHLSEAIDQHTWAQNSGASDDPWWQYSALDSGRFVRTGNSGNVVSNFSGRAGWITSL